MGAVPLMALMTRRPVKKGEELLVSYSHYYWLKVLQDKLKPAAMSREEFEAVSNAYIAYRGEYAFGGDESLLREGYQDSVAMMEFLMEDICGQNLFENFRG